MEIHTKIFTFILFTTFIITAFGQDYDRRQRPRPRCRWGSVGECDVDGYCPTGSRCQLGRCCRNMPVSGTCPPPSDRAGICAVIPGWNCLSNESCGRGQLCCSERCGRVCKDAIYVPDILAH